MPAHARVVICDSCWCACGGDAAAWQPSMRGDECLAKKMRSDDASTVEHVIGQRKEIGNIVIDAENADAEVSSDRAGARHACYRAFIKWYFSQPLGRQKRVRISDCVVYTVRELFPCPECGPDCDFLRGCEHKGHYTGFKSAAASDAAKRVRKAKSV